MRHLALIAVAVLTLACGGEGARTPPVAERTAAAPAPPPREVKPSPEVLALLEPDPDLDGTLTPEEVRATLDAAKTPQEPRERPRRAAGPLAPPSGAPSEWSELERQKRERQQERESRLAAMTVYVAGSDTFWYHSSGCEELYRYFFDRDKVLHRIYIGRPITLGQAAAGRITPHPACGPPSYDF